MLHIFDYIKLIYCQESPHLKGSLRGDQFPVYSDRGQLELELTFWVDTSALGCLGDP